MVIVATSLLAQPICVYIVFLSLIPVKVLYLPIVTPIAIYISVNWITKYWNWWSLLCMLASSFHFFPTSLNRFFVGGSKVVEKCANKREQWLRHCFHGILLYIVDGRAEKPLFRLNVFEPNMCLIEKSLIIENAIFEWRTICWLFIVVCIRQRCYVG